MLKPSLYPFIISSLLLHFSEAIVIPVDVRIPHKKTLSLGLQRRANATAQIGNDGNVQYLANMTLGGQPFVVTIDTGSSDLWVAEPVPGAVGLGKQATVTYAIGQASGQVSTAPCVFSGYTVPDQAFIAVPPGTADNTDGAQGLIGLGPSRSSVVRQAVGNSAGDPFLDRVFRQNTSTPNFITFALSRSGDVNDVIQGQFTIGEVLPQYQAVTNQPKLPVKLLPGALGVDQHWTTVLDKIIGPDGQNIPIDTIVPGVGNGQFVAVFDSGFTLPQVPRSVSDAIYGRVKDAQWDDGDGVWLIPCQQELNITVVIAGQNYPIHPLDTSSSDLLTTGVKNNKGEPLCVGTFQPITSALDGTFDVIMGMAFLRNTYSYFDFGDFVDGNPDQQGDPFIQLLSITNTADAHKDFVQLRLNGVDTTSSSQFSLLPSSQEQHSPESSSEKRKDWLFHNWPWVAAAAAGVMVFLIAYGLYYCCKRRSLVRGGRRQQYGGQGGMVAFIPGPYRPIHEPGSAPGPGIDLHTMPPPPQYPYSDPYRRG